MPHIEPTRKEIKLWNSQKMAETEIGIRQDILKRNAQLLDEHDKTSEFGNIEEVAELMGEITSRFMPLETLNELYSGRTLETANYAHEFLLKKMGELDRKLLSIETLEENDDSLEPISNNLGDGNYFDLAELLRMSPEEERTAIRLSNNPRIAEALISLRNDGDFSKRLIVAGDFIKNGIERKSVWDYR